MADNPCRICGERIPEDRPKNAVTCSKECALENKRRLRIDNAKRWNYQNPERFKEIQRRYYARKREHTDT